MHNYFKTEEEAEMVAYNVCTHVALLDLVEELNSKPIDWMNFWQKKFYLYYDFGTDQIVQGFTRLRKQAGTIYCTNKEIKYQAISFIGKTNLSKYLKGE